MPELQELLVVVDASVENLRREMLRGDSVVGDFERGVKRNLDRVQQSLDKTAKQTKVFADQVSANLRVATDFRGAERAKDIEAYGRRLDDLRAKYNPVFAAQQRYQREVEDIGRALRVGALSQEEYTAAVARAQSTMDAGTRMLATGTAGAGRFGTAIQQAGFQVGDFAVQVASGGGVLRPFIQQGTQLVSMFGPIGAVVGAAGAVIGALAVSLFDASDASSDATDALEEYNQMLATTRDLSSDTAGALRDLAGAHRDSGVAALEGSLSGAVQQQDVLRRQIKAQQDFVRALQQGPTFGDERRQAENDLAALVQRFDQNADAIDSMNNRLFILRDALGTVREETAGVTAATIAKTSALDTALNRLEGQIAANDNLILTYGMQEEAIARVQAEEVLLGAARQDGLKVTEQQRERMALLLDQYEEGERRIRELREETERQEDAQRAAQKAAEDAARAQIKAAEDARREYEKLIDSIANVSQEKLGDALFDTLKGGTVDFAEFLKTTLLRAIADIAAAAITRQIVIPIAAQVVGGAPGLFGLSGGAAQVAQAAAGGNSPFGGMNPLSLLNSGSGGSIYNALAYSNIGQALGLSIGAGAASAAVPFGSLFAAGSAPALAGLAPSAALALTGPAGGFGSIAGLATASTGGAVGAAGLGGAATGLTGLGSALGAAVPYIGIALAALSLFSGVFGGNPSVGPVGIADFSPGLGRKRAFDVTGIDPFTADNGGNPEALRPIAEAIADLIADSADRFSATINESLRFRVANYQGPESGSGRSAGFEVNAFLNQEAERRVAEGLSQEQAIFEALKFAVQEAFTFDSATIAEAAANTAATTTEELLADLDFADNFERLGQALAELGGTVDANTLALAQQTVAVQNQARDFAEQAAQPIIDALERAMELFPATRAGEEVRQVSERGIWVNEGEGLRERRFVRDDTEEFDRLEAGGGRVVTRVREVTEEVDEQAENYAANMERIRQATQVAGASVDLMVQQLTGEFEPAVRGPFESALIQGQANLEELASYFDDLNEQIMEANEAFPGLNAALIDTNSVLTDAMQALREQLQADFTEGIQRQLNAATGLGAVNVINDLIDARTQNATDAAALGIDVNSTAGELFDAQLRQTLEGASLADLNDLLKSGQIVDEGAQAILNAILNEKSLTVAREQEVAAMEALQVTTQAFATAANQNARTLRQAASALLVDPNLSPLSPELRLQEARRQFEEAFNLANDANPTDELSQDAIQRLPGLSQTMLEASKAYYGSTEGYLADFNRAQDYLNDTALRQETIEQQQLDALRDIEAAIVAAGGASNLTPSQRAATQGFQFGTNIANNMRIYDALVAAGLPTPAGFGPNVSGNIGQLRTQNPAVDALLRAMGFATGGSFTVAGPAGNDNLLMPLRLTAGEAVNVTRQDTMATMADNIARLEYRLTEQNQISKALLYENSQLRRQQARWERRDALAQSSRPAPARRAYGA